MATGTKETANVYTVSRSTNTVVERDVTRYIYISRKWSSNATTLARENSHLVTRSSLVLFIHLFYLFISFAKINEFPRNGEERDEKPTGDHEQATGEGFRIGIENQDGANDVPR